MLSGTPAHAMSSSCDDVSSSVGQLAVACFGACHLSASLPASTFDFLRARIAADDAVACFPGSLPPSRTPPNAQRRHELLMASISCPLPSHARDAFECESSAAHDKVEFVCQRACASVCRSSSRLPRNNLDRGPWTVRVSRGSYPTSALESRISTPDSWHGKASDGASASAARKFCFSAPSLPPCRLLPRTCGGAPSLPDRLRQTAYRPVLKLEGLMFRFTLVWGRSYRAHGPRLSCLAASSAGVSPSTADPIQPRTRSPERRP